MDYFASWVVQDGQWHAAGIADHSAQLVTCGAANVAGEGPTSVDALTWPHPRRPDCLPAIDVDPPDAGYFFL